MSRTVFSYSVYILIVRKGNTVLQWAYKLNSISHSRELAFHGPCTGGKGRHNALEDNNGGCRKRNICVLSYSDVVISALDSYAVSLFGIVASFPHEIGRM
jgi:hypothetical protein